MQRVLVFCGSSPGSRPEYAAAAAELGRVLAARGLGLVYGGASVGLMGTIADAALGGGAQVIGVIPERLMEVREVPHRGLTELRVVATMHERKALMAELSDAVAVLPGGAGTLEELFEMYTWSQLGLHDKAIGLLNVAGYWDGLLTMLDRMVAERFLRAEHRHALLVERDPEALLQRLAAQRHRAPDTWLDPQSVPKTRSPASPRPGRM
ncbi:MAG: TIGR00730 family Rossman fold protein [Solirubrobacterales bacterium]|nr:TIGR00730 family Rossman fold protein [Solirubrobacterales bacterium]